VKQVVNLGVNKIVTELFHGVARFLTCMVATILIYRLCGTTGDDGPSKALNFILLLPVILMWIWVVGRPFANWMGEQVGSFLYTGDGGCEIAPQYSIAEARVREGNYEAAIHRYREYIEQYPKEVMPHFQIAEIQSQHFNHADLAILELKQAVPKAQTVEAFALINFRLADLLEGGDPHAALECLHAIQRQYPHTRQAKAAMERANRLIHPSASSEQKKNS
jgi:hypothetical protein